jgi:hypothetical protein
MSESDFLSYSSIYTSFSKGPKSIYYALGDEMLPGAILNIPQDDEDDEWGRTERISLERVYDFIGKIYKTLFDPYNSMPEISLVPGEAGSELNIAKNMVKLIGRPGIENGIFDLSVPNLVLGNVEIDGSLNNINIGTGLSLSENNLSFSSLFNIVNDTNKGAISYKDITVNLNDDGSTKNVEFNIDGKRYYFTKNGFEIDSGLNITIGGNNLLDTSGNLITKNIYPVSDSSYNIGSVSLYYNNLYANRINSFYVCTSNIYPMLYDLLKIGRNDYSSDIKMYVNSYEINTNNTATALLIKKSPDIINIGDSNFDINFKGGYNNFYGKSFSFFGLNDLNPLFYINTCGYEIDIRSVNIIPKTSGIDLGSTHDKFNWLYVRNVNVENSMTINGTLYTKDIIPLSGNLSIGSNTTSYKEIYANFIYDTRAVASDVSLYLCGSKILFRAPQPPDGSFAIALDIDIDGIEARRLLITRDLQPFSNLNTIGLCTGGYYALYLRDHHTGGTRMVRINNGVLEVY